jgi:N-acetylglucosamine malate deacetylase 2
MGTRLCKLLKALGTGGTLWPEAAAFDLNDFATGGESRLKVLLVVAHPDDESECAAAIYKITHELGGIVDQVIVTDGRSGVEYSGPGNAFYHGYAVSERIDLKRLARIRRKEARRVARVLRIRNQYFFAQPDTGFTFDPGDGFRAWDLPGLRTKLQLLFKQEAYDLVFTLLPTEETHGHHQTVAVLAVEAAEQVAEDVRPTVLGVQATDGASEIPTFEGLSKFPSTRPLTKEPVWVLDRRTPLPHHVALNYSIFVNWVIAEHKSQGLFQMEFGRKTHESFWLFEVSAKSERSRNAWRAFAASLHKFDSSVNAAVGEALLELSTRRAA